MLRDTSYASTQYKFICILDRNLFLWCKKELSDPILSKVYIRVKLQIEVNLENGKVTF